MKRLFSLTLIVLLFLLAVRGWWNFQLSPVSNDKSNKSFMVKQGESFSQVADQLQKEELIRSSFVFKLYLRQKGDLKLQAGAFKLSPSMSADQIIKILQGGPNDAWVTLLEGWRVEEMAEELNQELGINSNAFLKIAKEGYMFPDTYLFPKDYSVDQIAQTMRDNFERKFTQELREKVKKLGLKEADAVILSSVVEREARSYEARKMVASILLKRLTIDMGLNADATIQYALGYQSKERSWWKRHLTKEDLKVSSPYNTYLYRGLPPTAICNPSLMSLEAVANADPNTPYLYYYHDSKGNSFYAKTLDEHNQNVANNP